LARLFNRLFTYPQWFIGYRPKKPFSTPFDTSDFHVIAPPPGKFYADPFLLQNDGRNFIFFEEFSFIKLKGVICFVEIDEDGNYSEPEVVLERDYHLSYPFIFRLDDKIYMIPETGENGTIELYSAKDFPFNWTLEKVIMKALKAYDTTILFSGQKVWMFTNIWQTGGRPYTDLSLFYADSIFDEWSAHPKNPVICDLCSARPAGNLFLHNDDIIRPSQNSLVGYGHSIVFNKVTCLSENDYSEMNLEQIEPNWYPGNQSCHTYNFNEDLEVIDGEVINRDFLKPYRKMASYLYRFK